MSDVLESWERRLAQAWASFDDASEVDFIARIQALADELPADDAIACFELASAQDSTGHPDRAVPLYERALAHGLSGLRRRRAVIQLASSLRNLGHADESVGLLTAELDRPDDELSGAVSAFLALALVDSGREREAVGRSLLALSRYLPRYNASLSRYAGALMTTQARQPGAVAESARGHADD